MRNVGLERGALETQKHCSALRNSMEEGQWNIPRLIKVVGDKIGDHKHAAGTGTVFPAMGSWASA